MAGNKITAEDIFDIKNIEAYKSTLEGIIIGTKELTRINVEAAQANPFKTAKDLKEFNKASVEGSKAMAIQIKAEKELIASSLKRPYGPTLACLIRLAQMPAYSLFLQQQA